MWARKSQISPTWQEFVTRSEARRVRANPDTTLSLSVPVCSCSCMFLNIAQAHRHTRRLASLVAPSHFALAPGLTQRRRAVHTNPCRSKQHNLTMTSLYGTDGMAECHDVRNRQAIAGNSYMLGYSAACLRVRMHECTNRSRRDSPTLRARIGLRVN
jgi:hypothetical protein